MRKHNILFTIIFLIFSIIKIGEAQNNFYAYYTKVRHSATDYMGKYADIIVVLGKGKQLEFTRQTGYLPRWRTPKVVQTIDDLFPGRDPDYEFKYNYVRLLKNGPDKIVVHWRYFKDIKTLDWANKELDPLVMHGFTGVIHEIFTIYPDGRVERVVKEAQNTRAQDWKNPELETRQTIFLKDDGIEHGEVHWGKTGPFLPRPAVKGNPIKKISGEPKPLRKWTFDDGMEPHEDIIIEEITEAECSIEGLMTVYKKGVSGTALAFDGYYSGVKMKEALPKFQKSMSINAWIALDVYPYNIAPIIHQSKSFGQKGYYLGLDAYGHLIFIVNGQKIQSSNKLPLYTWTNVAAVVGNGEMALYIDGQKQGSAPFNENIEIPNTVLSIGLNTEKERCTDYVRGPDQNIPFIYGIQGLIDEVALYDVKLSDQQISKIYQSLVPKNKKSDLAKAVLPGELGVADKFGATYKTLTYHELWDNMWRLTDYADIVVKFDNQPTSVIYWHGTNYAANWVTDNNRWMADQSSEIFTKHGCSEHMADKQNRHSYARIIENTAARVVIHWRYPCVDVGYVCTNRRNWTDEYHTIYPDGVGVRKVVWNKGYNPPGFQDIQFFTNPGETALDVVDLQAMTLANTKGEIRKLKWEKPNKIPENTLPDACIELLNSKSRYKVFAIFQGGNIHPWGEHEQSKYTDDPFAGPWNHWPTHLVPSDGRFAVAHDRVTHFALGANDAATEYGGLVMYGFTNQSIKNLIPLAKSWRNPPQIKNAKGIKDYNYDRGQRAYVMKSVSNKMEFDLAASADEPLVNPCLVIKNWQNNNKATLKVDGTVITPDTDFRQGMVYDTDGSKTMIIWLKLKAIKSIHFDIEK